ncbi:MAG: AtpZ/AtpI family protein [Eubacteriales bacterium]|nr:AtpZ/AtpI family protein [Eubacteriales bacterium]
MDNRQILRECAENLALLAQLGISIAVPPLLCLYAADWLRDRFSLGGWILAVGLVIGIGGGVMSAWKFWRMIRKRFQNEDAGSSGSGKSENIGGEEHQD